MKSIKKYLQALVFCLPFAAFCLSIAASAQMNYYNADDAMAAEPAEAPEDPPEKARSFTVTSIQKCYDLLSREDVLDIQQNYIKPYQECQRRAALNLKKKQEEKKAADAKDESSSKKQRDFYRVQKKATPPPEASEDKPSP
ncbi:MAG: hypothetical protein V1721_03945 [Pseudomonadota bacterium]